MASNTVAVRLPEDVLEQLQKKAEAENKKVSDIVRELIVTGLQPRANDSQTNAQVIEYLEGFGGVLMGILFQSVASRFFAEMATSYSIDMESLLREAKPLNKEAKEALMGQFEQAALHSAQQTWARVLHMEQKGEDEEGGSPQSVAASK